MTTSQELRDLLAPAGQEHVLAFWDRLNHTEQESLARQIRAIDWSCVPAWIERYVTTKPDFALPAGVEPASHYGRDGSRGDGAWDIDAMREAGEALLRSGKVACFTVAGGQGSRLGYEGPKGCYPAGAVTRRTLFQMFADSILAAQERFGRVVPWYIMTSPLNHDATKSYFSTHDYLGLEAGNVQFFMQGTMPSFDVSTGRVLLSNPHTIATNPDGHGGSLKALVVSGAIDDLRRRGIEHISYFHVDNPIVKPIDPVFLGLHALAQDSSGEMSSKMIPKAYAEEKLGMFCSVDGQTRVIEYSDLPMERQRETDENGTLRFLAGSIGIHTLGVDFVARVGGDPNFALPFHRADKKIPHVNTDTGEAVEPAEPNGVKLEQFVFDALELAKGSIVYETDRVEEFAPIKNAEGVDSPASSAQIQTQRAARWLGEIGVDVPTTAEGEPDCVIELSPRTAMTPDDLRTADVPDPIEPGSRIAL